MYSLGDLVDLKDGSESKGHVVGFKGVSNPYKVAVMWPNSVMGIYDEHDLLPSGLPASVAAMAGVGSVSASNGAISSQFKVGDQVIFIVPNSVNPLIRQDAIIKAIDYSFSPPRYFISLPYGNRWTAEADLKLSKVVFTVPNMSETRHYVKNSSARSKCECGGTKLNTGHADWCEVSPFYKPSINSDCNCFSSGAFNSHMAYCISQSPSKKSQ